MAESPTVRVPRLAEADAYAELLWQSFGLGADFCAELVDQHLPDRVRVALHGSEVVGGLLADPQGQAWGGRVVPVVCVGGVAVDPVVRRRGVASALMRSLLAEHYAAGRCLAVLHASHHGLYRSLGFEHAGVRQVVRVAPGRVMGDARAADVVRLGPRDRPEMQGLYNEAVLPHRDGALQRSDLRWDRALGIGDGGSTWWVGTRDADGALTGFVCWSVEGRAPSLVARVRSFVTTTSAGAAALRGVLGQLGATVASLELATGPDDPLWWALDHPCTETCSTDAFLVRVLDPVQAVRWWGFGSAEGTVRFRWHDPLFPDHDGPVALTVERGRGRWAPTDHADLSLGPRGLAALLTGRVAPASLAVLGLTDRVPPAAWGQVFPRRTAYLRDMF